MAKLQIPNLKPGTSYRIVIEGQGVSGESLVLPSIEFTTPTAPISATNESLSINSETLTQSVLEDRVAINTTDGKCIYSKSGYTVTMITPKAHSLKKNDMVKVESIGSNYNVSSAIVLSASATTNTFTYTASTNTGTKASGTAKITELLDDSAGKTKTINRLSLKIPEKIMGGLIWTDDVRDVVHIVYRKAKNKNLIAGNKRKYTFNNNNYESSSPRQMTFSDPIYEYGMPKITTFDITDNKYYEFQFALARYLRSGEGTESSPYVWTGYWLEDEKRFSKTTGWSA